MGVALALHDTVSGDWIEPVASRAVDTQQGTQS